MENERNIDRRLSDGRKQDGPVARRISFSREKIRRDNKGGEKKKLNPNFGKIPNYRLKFLFNMNFEWRYQLSKMKARRANFQNF